MKLASVSQYDKISFSEIKVPDMILRKSFNSRLGSACSHPTTLLFKLIACSMSMVDLNKVACTSKLCARKKFELKQILDIKLR